MKTYILSALVCSCMLVPEKSSDAGQLNTVFAFYMSVGESSTQLTFPTPQGKRLILPAALDNLNCLITDVFYSDDGKRTYHNVVCTDTRSPLVVGMTVSCPRFTTGSDHNRFFILADNANVGFEGFCATSQSNATMPRATGAVL